MSVFIIVVTSLTFWFVIIFIKTLIMTMILILSNAPPPSRLNRRKQKWYQSWMVDIIWLLLWPSVSPSRLQSCHHLMIVVTSISEHCEAGKEVGLTSLSLSTITFLNTSQPSPTITTTITSHLQPSPSLTPTNQPTKVTIVTGIKEEFHPHCLLGK